MTTFIPDGYALIEDRRSQTDTVEDALRSPIFIEITVEKIGNTEDQTVYVKYDDIDNWLNADAKPRVIGGFLRECALEEEITLSLHFFETALKTRLVLREHGKRQPTLFPGASHAHPYYLC